MRIGRARPIMPANYITTPPPRHVKPPPAGWTCHPLAAAVEQPLSRSGRVLEFDAEIHAFRIVRCVLVT